MEWGADQQILMWTFWLIIHPKLDYGLIVYCSASEAALRTLDVVMNEAMFKRSVAFKTSPVRKFSTEPSLAVYRKDITLQISQCFCRSCPNATPSLVIRAKEALVYYKIPNQSIAFHYIKVLYLEDDP